MGLRLQERPFDVNELSGSRIDHRSCSVRSMSQWR